MRRWRPGWPRRCWPAACTSPRSPTRWCPAARPGSGCNSPLLTPPSTSRRPWPPSWPPATHSPKFPTGAWEDGLVLYLLVILAVVLGALAQRVAGLGFAMISAPMLVLLLGAFDGVLMVNLCGAISATLIITRVWQYIDWRQFVMLLIPALIFIVPGAIISVRLAGPVLQISVGAILVLALSMSMLVRRAFHRPPVLPSALVAGAVSGFTNVTAGIGGPALSVHAVLTRWDPRIFAATVQPYF